MFDGKFICTLIALIIAVLAICNINTGRSKTVENFFNTAGFVRKPSLVAAVNGGEQSLRDTFAPSAWKSSPGLSASLSNAPGVAKPEFYQSTPHFQSNLAPRFANTQFGSQIKYNVPDHKNMAAPKSPLGHLEMAKEDYTSCEKPVCDGSDAQSCTAGDAPPHMKADYNNGNYAGVLEQVAEDHPAHLGVTDSLPITQMDNLNPDGTIENKVVYDRLMVSNRNSRLRSQGCTLRGDLPIPPCKTGWFQVSANPTIDLNQGAMQVLAGTDNETSNSLAALINSTTGQTAIAGANLTPEQLTFIGSSGNDVNVTLFP
jgi:hypothetical protein